MKHTLLLVVGGAAIAGALLVGITAFAQTPPAQNGHMGFRGGLGPAAIPGVVGTVSAVNGDTLTVTSKGFAGFGRPRNATTTSPSTTTTPTTYTVDATNATVVKNGASSTLSAVGVGDTVFVQGTVSGSNVAATAIRDGVVPGMMGGGGRGMGGSWNASGTWNGSSTMMHRPMPANIIQGNGQPVVGGSVTALSGDTLTVTTAKNDVVYSVDATNATIEKGDATSTIGNIAVGDDVIVQGAVSGTAVTASSIIDQGMPRTASSTSGGSASGGNGLGGFMGAIGGFFHHLFGFF